MKPLDMEMKPPKKQMNPPPSQKATRHGDEATKEADESSTFTILFGITMPYWIIQKVFFSNYII